MRWIMLSSEKVLRINKLSNKAKTEGLSADEKIEQQQLREEYLQQFRHYFRSQLDNIEIVDDEVN